MPAKSRIASMVLFTAKSLSMDGPAEKLCFFIMIYAFGKFRSRMSHVANLAKYPEQRWRKCVFLYPAGGCGKTMEILLMFCVQTFQRSGFARLKKKA